MILWINVVRWHLHKFFLSVCLKEKDVLQILKYEEQPTSDSFRFHAKAGAVAGSIFVIKEYSAYSCVNKI